MDKQWTLEVAPLVIILVLGLAAGSSIGCALDDVEHDADDHGEEDKLKQAWEGGQEGEGSEVDQGCARSSKAGQGKAEQGNSMDSAVQP